MSAIITEVVAIFLLLILQGYVFEVLDMDRHRVDKVLVMPSKPTQS